MRTHVLSHLYSCFLASRLWPGPRLLYSSVHWHSCLTCDFFLTLTPVLPHLTTCRCLLHVPGFASRDSTLNCSTTDTVHLLETDVCRSCPPDPLAVAGPSWRRPWKSSGAVSTWRQKLQVDQMSHVILPQRLEIPGFYSCR